MSGRDAVGVSFYVPTTHAQERTCCTMGWTYEMAARHQYLEAFDDETDKRRARELAAYVLTQAGAGTVRLSRDWKKDRHFDLAWGTDERLRTARVGFRSLGRHIYTMRDLDFESFGFPQLACWMDASMTVIMNSPMRRKDGSFMTMGASTQGEAIRLHPKIDREGKVFTSTQSLILQNIVRLHKAVVAGSEEALDEDNLAWLNSLRMLACDTVAIVDVTLHQLYYRAENRPDHDGWKFEPHRLKKLPAMRIQDKLRWVGLITGNSLDRNVVERSALNQIKAVRNHLQHFDPPIFAYDLEDVCSWLNCVPKVGALLWGIRRSCDAQVSRDLVRMLMLPQIRLRPIEPEAERPRTKSKEVGWISSTWPSP